MSASLLENNDFNMLSSHRGKVACSGIEGHLMASGAENRALQDAIAEVWGRYPFPPANCDDATTKIKLIEAALVVAQNQLASGASNRVAKRYIAAYQQVGSSFKAWVISNKCEAQAIAQDDNAFWDQVTSTLDKEKASGASVSGVDNWIVFGVLGVLAAGALIIILKKQS